MPFVSLPGHSEIILSASQVGRMKMKKKALRLICSDASLMIKKGDTRNARKNICEWP